MSKTLPERLRDAARKLRTSSMPLSDYIPLLQQAADYIEAQGVPDVDSLTDAIAKEANIDLEHHVSIGREPVWIATQDELERFTALVMEECAKVVSETVGNHNITAACAAAIRARKPA